MRTLLTLCLLCLPTTVGAAVSVNEVAWMGSAASANHEWIELYNSGSTDTSVEGWILRDGLNLEITLSGSIKAQSYAVLERTSEDSAPGSAFLLYTGALVNTGATLTLYNENGGIVDQVAGGENWIAIGGSNETKDTAQYTTAGWITAAPTPGASNRTVASVPAEDEEEEESETTPVSTSPKSKSGNSSKATVRLKNATTELKLSPDVQSVAYVNQPITLTVTPSGIGETISDSLVYTWNFGDSETAVGKTVRHAYAYAGTYVVTVRAAYARHNEVARTEITVLPTSLSLTRGEGQAVQLHNNAPYDVDVSGFVIQGTKSVILPPDTIVLPKATITIPSPRIETIPGLSAVLVYDQAMTLVASTKSKPEQIPVVATASPLPTMSKVVTAPVVADQNTSAFNFITQVEATELPPDEEASSPAKQAITATPSEGETLEQSIEADTYDEEPAPSATSWPYLALIALLTAVCALVLLSPRREGSPHE